MEELIRLMTLLVLLAIVVSLGSALFHLARGRDDADSAKMARALTVRITLSVVLFALLLLAWHFGLIHPHGMQPR